MGELRDYKNTTTIEVAGACGRATGDLPWAWQRGGPLLSDPALEADGTPLVARASDDGGLTNAEWSAARLVLLPKKGDLVLTNNWCGICPLDIGSKILSNVMVKRTQALMDRLHHLGRQGGGWGLIDHMTRETAAAYKGTDREAGFLIYHDALSVFTEKEAQDYIKSQYRRWASRCRRASDPRAGRSTGSSR